MLNQSSLSRQALALVLLFNILAAQLLLTRFDAELTRIGEAAHIEAPEPEYLAADLYRCDLQENKCRFLALNLTQHRSSLPFSQ